MSDLDGIPLGPDTTQPAPAGGDLGDIPLKDTTLKDNYDQASRVDPNHAAKVLAISKSTGMAPSYVSNHTDDAEAASKAPSEDFFDDVQANLPKTAALIADRGNMAKVHDDLGNLAAHEHVAQNFQYAKTYYQAIKAGVEGSVFGHIYDRGAPDIRVGPQSSYGQSLTAAAVGMAADFPFMVIGGAGAMLAAAPAGPAAVLAGGPGAFALPALLKTSISEYYRTGDFSGVRSAIEKSWNVAKETGKQATVGLATELSGGIVNKATVGAFLPTAEQMASMTLPQFLAKLTTQNAAMTATGSAVEGRAPTFRDFSTNMMLAAGLEGVHFATNGSVLDHAQARDAQNYVEVLDQFAQKSEFRKRDPEGYAAHINEISSGPVRIPVDAFEKAIGTDPRMLDQLGVTDSYAEAKRTGGDVEVPLGSFLSEHLDKQRAALAGDVKFDSDAKTQNQLSAVEDEAAAKAKQKGEAQQKAEEQKQQTGFVQDIVGKIKTLMGLGGEEQPAPKSGEAESQPIGQPSAAASGGEPPQGAPAPSAQTGEDRVFSPLDKSVTEHPIYVKALEASRPILAEHGVSENDSAGIVRLYQQLHGRMHDLLAEAKTKPSPERLAEISAEMNKTGAQDITLTRHANIVSDPETWLPFYEKRDAGQEAEVPETSAMQKFLETPEEAKARNEIAAANIEMGRGNVELPGVDPKLAEQTAKLEAAAQKEAESILMRPILDEMKAENVAKYEARKAELTAKAEADVAELPVFQAGSDLREAFGQTREPADIAKKFLESTELPEAERLQFETIAELNGFSSGDEMAQKIVNAWASNERENLVKSIVEQDLQELRPLKDPVKLRLAALEAVHNGKMADLLALKKEVYDSMKLGKEQDAEFRAGIAERAKAAVEDAKQFAKDTIARKAVEEAGSFRPYYTAERDAALRAYKAAKAGDYEAASKATSEQLQAHALASESLRAKDSIARWVKSLAKEQGADQSTFKVQEHFDQAAELLRRFGFERADYDPSQKVETLAQWSQRMQDKTGTVAIPAWLMDESASMSYRKLNMMQLHDLRDAVKNVKRVANTENEMWTIRKGEGLSALVEELHAAKEANVEGGKIPGAGTYESRFEKLIRAKDAVRQALINPESLFAKLDGFETKGPWQDTLIESKSRAEDVRAEMMSDAAAKWREIHSEYTPAELRDMDSKPIFVPEFKDSLTKNDIMTLAANQGTAGNRQKLLEGRGWNQDQVDSVLNREMTARDWDTVQKKIDFIGSYREQIGAMYKRLTGFEPDWVEAAPIKTKFGEKPGGYYPLVPDPRVVVRGFEEMKNDEALNNPPPVWKASTRNGFTETRNQYARYAVSLDANGAIRHVSDVIHDLSMREWVLDANRIMGSKDVQHDIVDALGMDQFQSLKQWTKQIAGNDVKPLRGAIENVSADLRRRSTVSMLGAKLSVMASQLHGLTAAAGVDPENFGVKDVGYAVMETYGKMLLEPSSFKEMSEWVDEQSSFMKQKQRNSDRDLADAARSLGGKDDRLVQAANYGFGLMDSLVTKPVWRQAYRKGLTLEGGDHDAAVAYADKIIRNSTVSGRRSDLPEMMRSSELGALFTMFHGFVDRQAQLLYRASGRVESVGDIPQFVGTAMNVMILPSAIYALTHYGLPDDKQSAKKWTKSMLHAPFAMVPVVSTMADWALDHELGIKGNASLTPVGSMADSVKQLFDKVDSRKARTQQKMEAATKVASFAVPYPDVANSWLWNTVDYVHNGMKPQAADAVRRRPVLQRKK